MDGKYIAYYRVSTKRQGESGLGLAAQKQAVAIYLNGGNWELLAEFTEVESGKVNTRPKLTAALDMCRLTGATLVVSKLDRLSRDSAFLNNLIKSDVKFTIVDFPNANTFMLQVFAALAEYERKQISERTKAALARSTKVKGSKGMVNLRDYMENGREDGVKAVKNKADAFAVTVAPIIKKHMDAGLSLKGTAKILNDCSILTARGHNKEGKRILWTATAVKNVVTRLLNT